MSDQRDKQWERGINRMLLKYETLNVQDTIRASQVLTIAVNLRSFCIT